MAIYHSLFNYSPIDRRLGCFQYWAIINKTAVNIEVEIFVHVLSFILGKYLGVKFLGYMISIYLTF